MLGKTFVAAAALLGAAQASGKVPGKVFDRIAIIYLENTDYTMAMGDPNLAALAKKGITLSNYFGISHPSEPNYIASIGGDNFGMDNDALTNIPANVSTVIDLLEDKGISWGEYQENMPSDGFTGNEYPNPKTQANMYVRKHNPAVIYDSVNTVPSRVDRIKNLTAFHHDLKHNLLPQWMFITPNMTSDGHDTSVTVAGAWTSNFLTPLLNNKHFMQKTLVLVTFDETHTYTEGNRVMSILIGDAVPQSYVGTTDDTFYDHYSEIATVEANWGLHTLGRWDVGANVFRVVADVTGDVARPWTALTGANPTRFLNESYAGPYNSLNNNTVRFPVPDTGCSYAGRTVLPAIQNVWGSLTQYTIYNTGNEIPDGLNPPAGYPASPPPVPF